jgi:hypothetical protein
MVFIYNGILLSYNEEWNLSFSGKCVELKHIILSEISQAQKAKNHMYFVIGI